MKKRLTKIIALMLSMVLLFSVTSSTVSVQAADAPTSSITALIEYLLDFFTKIFDVLGGTGGDTDSVPVVEIVSMEKGEVVAKGAKTSSTHASTIVKTIDGSLMSAWFGGSGEGNDDVRIWFSVYKDGAWGEAQQVPSEDTVAHWNPVLQSYGLFTRLYYKVGTDTKNWVTKYTDTFNNGKSWTTPKELVEGDTTGGRGPVKNKCLVTSKGVIIAPASTEQGDWKAFFDISKDGGLTWTRTDFVASDAQMIQPSLWEDDNGIHAFFRTKSGKLYRSDSTDGGYTWCEAYDSGLPNNNSGVDVVMTDNGWLWLAYNPLKVNGMRYKLQLAVSKDGGQTFTEIEMLEESGLIFNEYSYPSIIADGNTLYLTYTYEREKINYAIIEFAEPSTEEVQ